jgi:hypothetical protein
MKSTDYKTGWSVHSYIEIKSLTTFAFVDKFKCKNSGDKIEDEFLVVERTNFKHRGNETDESFVYNRKTSPERYKKVWEKWDELKQEKMKKVENIAKRYNFKVTIG